MYTRYVLAALMAAAMVCGGCLSRAVKEGLGTVTGAKGTAIVIAPVSSQSRDVALEQYTRFEIERFSDDFGGHTPARLISLLPSNLYRHLAKAKIPNRAGGKTLLIRGKVISYEDSTRAVSQVFGPFEEVVARVQLVDKASGRVLGEANCIGRSMETVNQGVDKKTEGLAEAVVSWIAKHYPKPAERAQHEE